MNVDELLKYICAIDANATPRYIILSSGVTREGKSIRPLVKYMYCIDWPFING